MHNKQGMEQKESCKKQKRRRIKLRSRSSRLALMVNDMLALWLGLAQAPELLKYLHGVQNERLIHFKSARAETERESWATFLPPHCTEVTACAVKWTAPHE